MAQPRTVFAELNSSRLSTFEFRFRINVHAPKRRKCALAEATARFRRDENSLKKQKCALDRATARSRRVSSRPSLQGPEGIFENI